MPWNYYKKELDQYKRKQKNLQNEVKRPTSENDSLRRQLSGYKGMRKLVRFKSDCAAFLLLFCFGASAASSLRSHQSKQELPVRKQHTPEA